MTAHSGPLPVPARITLALDAAQLWGPQVDIDLGGVEPMVDDWEAGRSLPTPEQVERLAALTGHPVGWFYASAEAWETEPTRIFMCQRNRRPENALTVVRSWVDWDGVQHIEQETPERPPYRPRRPRTPSTPETTVPPRRARKPRRTCVARPDPAVPGWCVCGLPLANARHIRAEDLPPAGDDPQTRAAGDRPESEED